MSESKQAWKRFTNGIISHRIKVPEYNKCKKQNVQDEQVKIKCEKESNITYEYEDYNCNNYKFKAWVNQLITYS